MTGPLVVSYGMGVDSTAMLIEMAVRKIRPDLILFADTGGEKEETYRYNDVIQSWLAGVGFPPVTWVRYEPKRAPYATLEQKCIANEALPSLAYGWGTCATVFKIEPQQKYLKAWPPAREAWARGAKVFKAIGYDDGFADWQRRRRAAKFEVSEHYQNWYPLQDWKMSRVDCIRTIEAEGLPVPVKSACFFCPASSKEEILGLPPHLLQRALEMEDRARRGKHGFKTVKGLGRRFAWSDVVAGAPVDEEELLRP